LTETGKPIDEQEMTGPKKKVLPKIISVLLKQLILWVIPFYYLYTSQTILPEMLKNIDKILCDTLLLNAGFPLTLVFVELVLETDNDSYSKGDKIMKIHNFPYKVYESSSPDSQNDEETS
jgi:hypothetical protein